MIQETMAFWDGSDINWTIRKQSAPHSRQITTPTPHHSTDAQPTVSKHCKQEHTHTHPFNGPFSGTTRVSRYQKGKTKLDFTEARGSEWQWHQLGHMQVCITLQTDNHASIPPLKLFTGRMPFLPPNQQHQSNEGTKIL